MKKIFLLTLLNVFFLSAFCQRVASNTEIITVITLEKYIPDDEIEKANFPWQMLRAFFYRDVRTVPSPDGGVVVYCSGWGFKTCMPSFDLLLFRGVSSETIENTCSILIQESETCVVNGTFKGTLSKKITAPTLQNYWLFTINWNYDPKNHYNGKAEIIISKTDDFGL